MDSFDFVCPYCRRQSLVDMGKGYKYYTGSDGEVNQEFDQNMPITARYPKDLSRLNTKNRGRQRLGARCGIIHAIL